jgi:hypothetical protein
MSRDHVRRLTPVLVLTALVLCQRAGGQGWALGISAFRGITNATAIISKAANIAPLFTAEDTLTWLKGTHSVSAGASFTRVTYRNWGDTVVPNISFGVDSKLDSVAYTMLDATSGHYPGGISSTWATCARNLYAVLTGP